MQKTILIIFIFISNIVAAQYNDMKFQRISLTEGLSQVFVNIMYYDSKGYIWIGTQDGLNLYDGYTFKIFRPDFENPEKSINNNIINSINEDSNQNIWIGTLGGLNFYDRRHEKFFSWTNIPEDTTSIVSNLVFAVNVDNYNNIWFLTSNAISRLTPNYDDISKSKITNFNNIIDNDDIRTNGVFNCVIDKYKNLWIYSATQNIYYIPNIETNKNILKPIEVDILTNNSAKIPETEIWGINTDKEGNLYVLSQNYISKIFVNENNQVKIQSYKLNNLPNIILINYFFIDKNFNLLVGTINGLIVYQNNFTEKYLYTNQAGNNYSLTQDNIIYIIDDDYGILWFGTSNGLNKFDKRKTQLKHVAPQPLNNQWLTNELVYSFSEDNNGEIWVGTVGGNGLHIYNKTTNKFRSFNTNTSNPDSLNTNLIRTIFKFEDNTFWIGSRNNGLYKYDKKLNKFKNYQNIPNDSNSLPNNFVYRIIKDNKNNLWIATHGGLSNFDTKTEKFTNYQNNNNSDADSLIGSNIIRSILMDKNKILWIGTIGSGLNKMYVEKGKTIFKKYNSNPLDTNSLSLNQIFDIYEDKDGFLWLGTFGGGLNKFDKKNKKFKRFTINDGLPSNVIYGILPDKNNNLWLSTNNGISCFNIEKETFKNYSIEDGLQSNEFNGGSFFIDSQNYMYFGGINGYNVFNPQNIVTDSIAPKLVFTDLKVFNNSVMPSEKGILTESILFAKEINLTYKDRDFSIEFSALHYASPFKNQYAYMMEGYDTDWIYCGTRHLVSYNSFPPGEYIFKVKACNSNGVWNETGISIIIIIEPPFWKTRLFYVLVLILITILIWFFIKVREKNLIREKQILEEKVVERTKQIREQNNQILQKNEELQQQKEEIQAQADSLEDANQEINVQKELLEKAHKNVTDSIQYASKIQNAVLPKQQNLAQLFPEHFIFYKPRDIVSGDFYFAKQINNHILIAAADCTGHGVPGAFMSMLGIAILNEIVRKDEIFTAAQVLDELREQLKIALQQTGQRREQQDGMDIAFCAIDIETLELSFAGAHNPLFLIRNYELGIKNLELGIMNDKEKNQLTNPNFEFIIIEADRQPVGVFYKEKPFTEHKFQLKKEDIIYIFSDGYFSQFGGSENETFKKRNFKEIIVNINKLPMLEQHKIFENTFEQWKGTNEQTDDVLVIGIKI